MTTEILKDKLRITVPENVLRDFCRRHHIRKLALFGSILSDDFSADSDIDVLVEFEPGYTPGLSFFTIQEELSHLLGRPVDLNTPRFLHPRFRHDVEAKALVQYVQS
jgi:uncharacterized protein